MNVKKDITESLGLSWVLALGLSLQTGWAIQPPVAWEVKQDRLWGKRSGVLTLEATRIVFQPKDDQETPLRWHWHEIQELRIDGPQELQNSQLPGRVVAGKPRPMVELRTSARRVDGGNRRLSEDETSISTGLDDFRGPSGCLGESARQAPARFGWRMRRGTALDLGGTLFSRYRKYAAPPKEMVGDGNRGPGPPFCQRSSCDGQRKLVESRPSQLPFPTEASLGRCRLRIPLAPNFRTPILGGSTRIGHRLRLYRPAGATGACYQPTAAPEVE